MIKLFVQTLLYGIIGGTGSGLMLMLLIVLATGKVQAAMPDVATGEIESGALLMRAASGQTVMADNRAPLLETRVDMDISGIIARVKVRQRFINEQDTWQEGVYVFPLPEDAAVDHMRMWIGEREIEAEIRTREKARAVYEQAKSEGKRSSLLEQERANIFTASVANIAPGDEVMVEMEYQQSVTYDAGTFSLRFPMVVAPRYIPGRPVSAESVRFDAGTGWATNTDQVADASRITPPVTLDQTRNPISLEIRLNTGLPTTSLRSLYHEIEIEDVAPGQSIIHLQQGSVAANRDFVLNWQLANAENTGAAWFTEDWSDAHYGVLMLVPPAQAETIPAVSRELVFVIDTSGSMYGDSLQQAKAALKLAIEGLDAQDSFNLIQFSDNAYQLFPAAVPVTPGNRQHALHWLQQLRAEGGTEMRSALQMALQGKTPENKRLRQIVFLTDGAVGNEQALLHLVQQGLGDARLFTVGIGSAPNSYFMSRAAEVGHGSFTYIGDLHEVQDKMSRLFRQIESPVLTHIRLDWGETVEQWPPVAPDLYLGEPVLVAVKSEHPLSRVVVSGQVGGQSWQQQVDTRNGRSYPGLHVLWARKQIHHLMAQMNADTDTQTIRQQVEVVALEHHLVSRYTSLVAVDQAPARRQNEHLDSRPVPVQMAAGWSPDHVFGRLPQTATPAQIYLLLGFMGLLYWSWRKYRAWT